MHQKGGRGTVAVVGGGLAGSEAAYQLSKSGLNVRLFEMKPKRFSPAHKSNNLAELVCSNSFRSDSINNAAGLLKDEMRLLGSLIMEAAGKTRIPAGKALAVDREGFSEYVTSRILDEKRIELVREEVTSVEWLLREHDAVVIATGPLTSKRFESVLQRLIGREYLYFYDGIAPLVEAESIDMGVAFRANRYGYGGGGEGDYLNLPMTREEYERFVDALLTAEKVKTHPFDEPKFFEGCMPIEAMAMRGKDTLRHGPMKPMGLENPRGGVKPYAVVQLRQDNLNATVYNIVGFQTRMTWPEQDRVFRMIPGLYHAKFLRYGTMHRNTFINGPALLDGFLRLKTNPRIYIAGQLTGVEGYIESAATGLYVGLILPNILKGICTPVPPPTTAIGALIRHVIASDSECYQPSNIIFGLFPPLEKDYPKDLKRFALIDRAKGDLSSWLDEFGIKS